MILRDDGVSSAGNGRIEESDRGLLSGALAGCGAQEAEQGNRRPCAILYSQGT
jgi:hypothetical protein